MTDPLSHATSYAYDDANRMTTTTLPSGTGVVSSYSYDNANRLTAISHDKGGTTLASASYTLDSVGNRTQLRLRCLPNRTSKTDAGGATAYAYDPPAGSSLPPAVR